VKQHLVFEFIPDGQKKGIMRQKQRDDTLQPATFF
jgi:hypothetical protein